MHVEVARALGGALLGACLGVLGAVYGKTEPGWITVTVVGFLALLSAISLIYSVRVNRNDFLDSFEDCQGDCKGKIQRRRLWRLPDALPKRKGLPVCKSCFMKEMQRAPNPWGDKLAYAKKGEEYEKTRHGRRERREHEAFRKRMLDALSAPVTEEYLLSELHDPWGREIPEVRKALDELRAQQATSADPQSPQSPKHGS